MSHGLPEPTPVAPAEIVSITDARSRFGSLVRRAAHTRRRVIITDHGQAAAAIISAAELEDLEDRLAIAQHEIEKAKRHAPDRSARGGQASTRARRVTYTLDWRENALNSLAGYLDDDPTGVGEVFKALDQFTATPYPPYASKIGPAFRMRICHYRIVYEVDGHTVTVFVIHVGRTI